MMIAQQIPIYLKRPHPNQLTILKDKARFRVVSCGRRFGKTELAVTACVHRLLKGQKIWYCSPTASNSKRVWRKFKAVFKDMLGAYINNSDLRMELPTGGTIELVSLHEPDNLRGEGLDFVVIDEAAFVSGETWDKVIRPMLLSDKGQALLISSPNGYNWFHNLYKRGLDKLSPEWASYHFTSYDNPLIDPLEIDQIRLETPQRFFDQEYLAEFVEDAGGVFRNVGAVSTLAPRNPYRPSNIVFGVDWAKSHDFTVVSVIDADTHEQVYLDRFNKVSWEMQRGRLRALYDEWQPYTIIAESNSIGSPNIEALQREGLPVVSFETTALSKTPLIDDLALAIERGNVKLLRDAVQMAELQAYQMERLPSGRFRYNSPDNGHDDTVIALALAWRGVSQGQRSILLWDI